MSSRYLPGDLENFDVILFVFQTKRMATKRAGRRRVANTLCTFSPSFGNFSLLLFLPPVSYFSLLFIMRAFSL